MDNNPVVSASSPSKKKVKRWLESFVPDYLVMEILSRLHVKNVIQCRCVCKSWRDLLSTPEFLSLYKEREKAGNFQLILVDERDIDPYYLDDWQSRKKPIVRRIHSYPLFRTEFSQEGFLVMSSICDHVILIVNPIESDGVKIMCPNLCGYQTNVYGIFFNPTLKEYCVLLGVMFSVFGRVDKESPVSYRMLTLGSNPCWRNLSNPFSHKLIFHSPTLEWARPVLVGDCLYWLVGPEISIMEFNTRTEEFILISVPSTQSNNDISTRDIVLLNIHGFLSFVQTFTTLSDSDDIDVEIDIWTLEDRVAHSWTNSKYFVTVDNNIVDPLTFRWEEAPKPIVVENGLLIFQFQTILFACNLEGNTTWICGKKTHTKFSRFFCHSISLSSLKNCKHVICMDGVDEKMYNDRCWVCSNLFKDDMSYGRVNKQLPSTSNRFPASSSAKKVKRWLESFVPELVMDIISRMPLKNVIQCRVVCKRWRDLLSTSDFAGLYKERGGGRVGNLQMILVDEPKVKSRIHHFFLDGWQFSVDPIFHRIHSYPSHRTEFSQEGFLVMSSTCSHSILIVNPIESHRVNILCPRFSGHQTKAYGIFFNPTLKQHCVLLGLFAREDREPSVSYQMLTLGAKPSWRHLSNPFNHKPMFHKSTMEWARPVLVGDYLYWLVAPTTRHDEISTKRSYVIMEFNTRTEEFILIDVPQSQSDNEISTPDTGLLNINGFLSSVQTFTSLSGSDIDVEIGIWTLKDRVAQSWTNSKYNVIVHHDFVDHFRFKWIEAPKPIAVEYGYLVFQFHTLLFACNLEGKVTWICGKSKHNKNSRFFCHSISLLSLKNCKPVICMEGVDEKTYNERCKVCSNLFKEDTLCAGVNKLSDVKEEPSTSYRDDGGGNPTSSEKRVKKWLESFVPDSLVMDILSRLHLKNVIQCRCVCKRWRHLLSTPEFLGLYKERGVGGNWQMILVDEPKIKSRIDLFYLDEWHSRKKPIVRRIHSYPSYRTYFSQDGFLFMSSTCKHSILIVNPIESHGVKILCPRYGGYQTNALGIFFNPTLKDHCVLFGVTFSPYQMRVDIEPSVSYRMLTLGAKPSWRHLSNPFNRRPMFHLSTNEWTRPVLVGDYLYWLVVPATSVDGISDETSYVIMEFNTRTEEFILIPIPPTESYNDLSTPEIGLLNIDGFLSSVQTFTSLSGSFKIKIEIEVWTLKDRVAQLWTNSMYSVKVDTETVDPLNFEWIKAPKPISVEYGLLILQFNTILFACNLKGKTIKICGKKRYNKNSRFFCHGISLVSLKKYKTVICMDGVDKEEYKELCDNCSKLFKEETSSAGVNKHSDVVEGPSTSYRNDGGGCKSGTSIAEQINPTCSRKL